MPTTPLAELVRLRGQCESEAKQQKLFARIDPNYLEWEEAQAARVKAQQEYHTASGTKQAQLLRDWAILSLHTIMPRTQISSTNPSCRTWHDVCASCPRQLTALGSSASCVSACLSSVVGPISSSTAPHRGATRPPSCKIELCAPPPLLFLRLPPLSLGCAHSYGPSCTTLSPMLSNVLTLYLDQLLLDAVEDPTPYLFHPKSMTTRCIGSSQWTQTVKVRSCLCARPLSSSHPFHTPGPHSRSTLQVHTPDPHSRSTL